MAVLWPLQTGLSIEWGRLSSRRQSPFRTTMLWYIIDANREGTYDMPWDLLHLQVVEQVERRSRL